MTANTRNGGVAGVDGMLEPEQLADTVINTLDEERFLVLPHAEVLTYIQRKTADYDRWLAGMQKLQATLPGSCWAPRYRKSHPTDPTFG